MKTSIFRKGLYSLRATLLAGVVGVLCMPSAFSAVIFQDNFNSYTDDASLLATWTRSTGTGTNNIFLTLDPVDPANQVLQQNLTAGRLRHVISGGVTPTVAEPTIVFSFDLYDVGGTGRQFGEFRNSAATTGLIAAGIYNSATVGTFDATKYSARNLDGGGWISLDTARSVGWHNFRFEITGTEADLYVDNVLEPKFGAMAYTGTSYDWLYLGSGLSSVAAVGYYDDLTVSVVPEPSAWALGLLAGLGTLLGRAWLRRR